MGLRVAWATMCTGAQGHRGTWPQGHRVRGAVAAGGWGKGWGSSPGDRVTVRVVEDGEPAVVDRVGRLVEDEVEGVAAPLPVEEAVHLVRVRVRVSG